MRKMITVLFILALTLMISGCKNTDNTIKLGFMPSLAALPYIYAEEEGYYKNAGINVEITIYEKSTDRDAAFFGKTLNGVSTDFVAVGTYLANNHPVLVTNETQELFQLVTSEYYGAAGIKDTNHASVGISEDTVVDYLVSKLESEYGLSYDTVGIPAVPERKAALESLNPDQRIDMAVLAEPYSTLVVNEGGKLLWQNTDDNLNVTCLAFDKSYADSHHDEIVQFLKATDTAISAMQKDSYDNYKGLLVKYGILDDTTVNQVAQQHFTALVKPDAAQFTDVMNWMMKKGLITKLYDLNDIQFDWNN